jgi:hypothetical protein
MKQICLSVKLLRPTSKLIALSTTYTALPGMKLGLLKKLNRRHAQNYMSDLYYIRYCRKGHSTGGPEPITNANCRTCGANFVIKCAKCGEGLKDRFFSPTILGSGAPVYPPNRPGNCSRCGKPYPWNSWHFKMRQALPGVVAKLWTEFKSLTPSHIILIIVVLLAIFGVLKWHDLVELIKSYKQ